MKKYLWATGKYLLTVLWLLAMFLLLAWLFVFALDVAHWALAHASVVVDVAADGFERLADVATESWDSVARTIKHGR